MPEIVQDHRVLILNGPSGCGKSRCIRTLGAQPHNTRSSEKLQELILRCAQEGLTAEQAAAQLGADCRFFENMESLRGKPYTQQQAAKLLNLLSQDRCVILTAIDCRNTLPYLLLGLEDCRIIDF